MRVKESECAWTFKNFRYFPKKQNRTNGKDMIQSAKFAKFVVEKSMIFLKKKKIALKSEYACECGWVCEWVGVCVYVTGC